MNLVMSGEAFQSSMLLLVFEFPVLDVSFIFLNRAILRLLSKSTTSDTSIEKFETEIGHEPQAFIIYFKKTV